MFTCSGCGAETPMEERKGRSARCKACRAAYQREYRRRNPEKVREGEKRRYWATQDAHKVSARRTYRRYPERWRYYDLRKKFGLTEDQFIGMYLAQDGKCDICGDTLDDKKKNGINVDHDHGTGQVRGLLCQGCNLGIGGLKDDPSIAMKAVQCLNRNRLRRIA
jgi:hypothetical protein